jgi:GNAT superfamily N-acetyltransferase
MGTVGVLPAAGPSVALGDRTEVAVRSIAPEDAEALVRFHAHLSRHAVTLRYFYPHLELSADEVSHLTQVDGRDRVALIVESAGEIIAVGRYDRLKDPTKAEVAFIVADAFQHRGIATLLLERLAELARPAGVTHFVAEVMAENQTMLSVFHGAGFATESTCELGVIELTMAIARPTVTLSGAQSGTCQSTRVPPPSTA